MIKKSIWHHNIFWSFFCQKKDISCRSLKWHMTSFFPQKMVPECKPEWNRESIMIFYRLPSWRRLQATPPLQNSLLSAQCSVHSFGRASFFGYFGFHRKGCLSETPLFNTSCLDLIPQPILYCYCHLLLIQWNRQVYKRIKQYLINIR